MSGHRGLTESVAARGTNLLRILPAQAPPETPAPDSLSGVELREEALPRAES
ncbi:hypothetical protein Ppa06_13620 [Planomonospora parontospora subsp. parontospora]|uniref:Uncharacterized protein n=2 Tax=Planomonospora parontospora TaxID=58119 RepID=A0AA37BDA6_9ACTN|nr:hypothetical protein [Planomonospora parontospora]GGK53999.1 hypothetical protein GCM10010126_11950 [Planomonospora parontospora]GII07564.1 hypothetical protein Ppa06_13620 [Planomonospora parontospora subsp. parontospora]